MTELHAAAPPSAQQNATADTVSTGGPLRTANRARRAATLAALAVASLFLGWRAYSDRAFWRSAWEQSTLFPEHGEAGASQNQTSDVQQRRTAGDLATAQFDLSNATVPTNQIHSGGPPKDGIPALTSPKLMAAKEASYLRPTDRVIGFVAGNQARAYPLRILNYHEIVNDRVGELPVAITYCPLCDSVAAFDRRTELGVREFGVSGLLYNSNVLMYDRASGRADGGRLESLWSQLKAEGISGPGANQTLDTLPVELTTWKDWLSRYPHTKVLSLQTGHQRNYERSPYADYFSRPDLMFPAQPISDALPTKEKVLGVWTQNAARAYPLSAFSRDRTRVEDTIGGRRIVIEFLNGENADAKSLRVAQADAGVQWMYSLWFAWHAFRPETEVFR